VILDADSEHLKEMGYPDNIQALAKESLKPADKEL
jgi:hypothetical protein